jgi:hypothetical protein
MITKYRTEVKDPRALIVPVDVLRETEHCVFLPAKKTKLHPLGERRESKLTEFDEYHDSWDLAHKSLTEKAERKILNAQMSLERAREFADKVKAMQDPAANGNAGRISGDT